MPASMPSGLRFFYELIQKLNSTLDLDVVLAQVIEQVNRFLRIDATSISLLDPNSKELVIQMTIGKETDPQIGLRLPPYAGIAGWVVHHAEPVLIADVQQDSRFYPAVDQRTNFTSRAMICVPLIARERPIGVIQAISKTPGIFSQADLYFMITLAEVTALHIENARLYSAERKARLQAEALRQVAEIVNSSLNLEQTLPAAMAILRNVVPFDRMAIATLRNGSENLYQYLFGVRPPEEQQYLRIIATYGLDEMPTNLLPVAEMPLFQQMATFKQPIDIADVRFDRRYVRQANNEQVRSWLGVPLIVENQVIGQLSIDRYQVHAFTVQEIDVAMTFAQHITAVMINARLYEQVRDRADDLTILNGILLTLNTSCDLENTLYATLDVIVTLFRLQAAAILLLDETEHQLRLCVQRGLTPESVGHLQLVSVRDHLTVHQVLTSCKTAVLASPFVRPPADNEPPTVCIWVPLVSHNRSIGILLAEHSEPHAFSVQDASLLETIGRQIGTTIRQICHATGLSRQQYHLTDWAIRARAMLYYADRDGQIKMLSLAVEPLTGYANENLINDPTAWQLLIHIDDLPRVESMRKAVLAGRPRGECTYRLVKKEGSLCTVRELAVPVCDQTEQVIGLKGLIVATDAD